MLKVIILSASKYSLYTISVTEELRRNNITPIAIIVKDIFSIKRFISEFKKNPRLLIKKIIKKIFFRKSINNDRLSLARLFNDRDYRCNSIKDLEIKHGLPVKTCHDFHEDRIIDFVKSLECDLIVFTGGGIIKKQLLMLPKIGILNCHMGVLPYYRGMDCHLWALINRDFKNIGLTTHFMKEGIDTGNILKVKKINIELADEVFELEDILEYHMTEVTIETILDIHNKSYVQSIQKLNEGRQYYLIKNKKLLAKARKNFDNYRKTKQNHKKS